MIKSADIRKENKRQIYQIMLDGNCYTKQQIARLTGLSVATCNTLLNDLLSEELLITEKEKELRGIGRGSARFRINAGNEYYIFVSLYAMQKKHAADVFLVDALGTVVENLHQDSDRMKPEDLLQMIAHFSDWSEKIQQIILSVPGVLDEGEISFCDLKELEGWNLKELLEKETGYQVIVQNDMHLMAYGYQAEQPDKEMVVTLAGFFSHLLPGTVTMHKGQIISGTHGIAGLAEFMPFDVPPEEIAEKMTKESCFDLMAKIVGAIIAFLNPQEIIMQGDLLDQEMVERLSAYCRKSVPEKYMPEWKIVSDFEKYLFCGMFQIAVMNKKF